MSDERCLWIVRADIGDSDGVVNLQREGDANLVLGRPTLELGTESR